MTGPRIGFVIGGAQKCGTSALASYLGEHPGLALPVDKEAHVFDDPNFDESWGAAEIDARYAAHLAGAAPDALCGDATPIYLFHPRLIDRIARYNPAMRWIVLLRHPAERALSHYHMERARGAEHWPLWPALLAERWRLRGHEDDYSNGSPLRHHSYRARGDYSRQLDALYARFPAEQVFVLKTVDLAERPRAVLDHVHAFLDLAPMASAIAPRRVFASEYPRPPPGSLRWRLLCLLFRRALAELRRRHGVAL